MSRHRAVLEKLLWMALIAWALTLLWGEALRDRVLSGRRRFRYPGPFPLLGLGPSIPEPLGRQALASAWRQFLERFHPLGRLPCQEAYS